MADRRWDNVLNFSAISIVNGNLVSRSRSDENIGYDVIVE